MVLFVYRELFFIIYPLASLFRWKQGLITKNLFLLYLHFFRICWVVSSLQDYKLSRYPWRESREQNLFLFRLRFGIVRIYLMNQDEPSWNAQIWHKWSPWRTRHTMKGKVQCQYLLLGGREVTSQLKLEGCLFLPIMGCWAGLGNYWRNVGNPIVMPYPPRPRPGSELHLPLGIAVTWAETHSDRVMIAVVQQDASDPVGGPFALVTQC